MPQLRQWFDQMDADRCGHVTKEQFLNFIPTEPQLRILLADDRESQLTGPREALARRRRQAKLWEEFCCGKEDLGWKEFAFYFRRRGWLPGQQLTVDPTDCLPEKMPVVVMDTKPLLRPGSA
jgi:hypothetical protein